MAELGRPERMCDLFDDLIDRDLALGALVEGRVSALQGKPITVIAGGEDTDDKNAAAAFREVWSRLDIDGLIAWHQFSALVYGWAATELKWAWNPDDRRWDPVDLMHVRSRLFRVATEYQRIVPGAEPDELLVRVAPSSERVERLVPDKWLITRRAPYLRVTRAGLLHACARYTVLRTQSWAHWFAFLRRYGLPMLTIEISSWADPVQQAQAQEIARRWGEELALFTDANGKVKPGFVDAAASTRSASSDPQGRFADAIREEFTRLWTGIPTGGKAAGVGDYHAIKSLAGIRADLLDADARRLAQSIRRGLIEPWMRLNDIPGEVPRLVIRLAERISHDPDRAVATAVQLQQLGYDVDPAQLEELTGLRLVPRNSDRADDVAIENQDA